MHTANLWARWRARAEALRNEVYALYFAYRDPRTPWVARLFALLVVAYALSPIDLIPDFIPMVGYLDDLLLVPLGVALALRLVPSSVMADCRAHAQNAANERPLVAWIIGGAVVAVWGVIAFALVRGVVMRIKGK